MVITTKTEFQDLEWAIPIIIKRFTKNKNSSISATFRFLRNHRHLSSNGCYPILSIIVLTLITIKIIPKRSNVLYALNQSEELKAYSKKEKNELLDELLNSSSVQMKTITNRLKINEKLKDDTLCIQEKLV